MEVCKRYERAGCERDAQTGGKTNRYIHSNGVEKRFSGILSLPADRLSIPRIYLTELGAPITKAEAAKILYLGENPNFTTNEISAKSCETSLDFIEIF